MYNLVVRGVTQMNMQPVSQAARLNNHTTQYPFSRPKSRDNLTDIHAAASPSQTSSWSVVFAYRTLDLYSRAEMLLQQGTLKRRPLGSTEVSTAQNGKSE
jgi:hypothetical protein